MAQPQTDHKIRLCFFFFATLILLDIIATINTLTPLLLQDEAFEGNITLYNVSSISEEDLKEFTSEVFHHVTITLVELFGLTLLVFANICALVGLKKRKAHLLVPWLFVYLIGIGR